MRRGRKPGSRSRDSPAATGCRPRSSIVSHPLRAPLPRRRADRDARPAGTRLRRRGNGQADPSRRVRLRSPHARSEPGAAGLHGGALLAHAHLCAVLRRAPVVVSQRLDLPRPLRHLPRRRPGFRASGVDPAGCVRGSSTSRSTATEAAAPSTPATSAIRTSGRTGSRRPSNRPRAIAASSSTT